MSCKYHITEPQVPRDACAYASAPLRLPRAKNRVSGFAYVEVGKYQGISILLVQGNRLLDRRYIFSVSIIVTDSAQVFP